MVPTRAIPRWMGVLCGTAAPRRRREPAEGWASRLDVVAATCEGEYHVGEGADCCWPSTGCAVESMISSGVGGVGGMISYGRGTSREARKRPTLVQCSFSTRKRVHMPLRQTSEKPTKKLRRAECCNSFE